jgi:hypothetical protein
MQGSRKLSLMGRVFGVDLPQSPVQPIHTQSILQCNEELSCATGVEMMIDLAEGDKVMSRSRNQ